MSNCELQRMSAGGANRARRKSLLVSLGVAAGVFVIPTFAAADALTTPAMSASLSANPSPTSIDAGPFGPVHVTGAVSALGYTQNRAVPGDVTSRVDVSNAQVFIQTTEGPVQFFVQAGAYSIPTIGVPYFKATDVTKSTFGAIPQAFVKFAPTENFNIMAGKLPTLIGAEYTFSFQNLNIQRGLLWNQENAVNRGLQANFSSGPISASVAINDGFYSDKYSWLSGLVAYAINDSNVLAVAAGGNLSDSGRSGSATPLLQNNSDIYNIIYTYTSGGLTISPYFQYTRVPSMPALGVVGKSSSTGFALLGKYAFSDTLNVAARGEIIRTKGTQNLLYGPGSDAWSLTLTPTFQKGIFFLRGELSYVKATDITLGSAFGSTGVRGSQTRALIETGFLF